MWPQALQLAVLFGVVWLTLRVGKTFLKQNRDKMQREQLEQEKHHKRDRWNKAIDWKNVGHSDNNGDDDTHTQP